MTHPAHPLSAKDVAKVAGLARLALAPAELERMTGELSKIVGFVSMLAELDTSAVEPLAHPLDTKNVFRDDVVQPGLDREEVLAAAPRVEEGRFHVPPIIGLDS